MRSPIHYKRLETTSRVCMLMMAIHMYLWEKFTELKEKLREAKEKVIAFKKGVLMNA